MTEIKVEGGPLWLLLVAQLIESGLMLGFIIWWASVMSRALRACTPHNRKMLPGNPYLLLIPVFGLIWQFVAVQKTSESLAQEYYERGWKTDEGRPGIETGMVACSVIIIVLALRILIIDLNPGLSFLMTLGICICIYMHRERLVAFAERIEQENGAIVSAFSFDPRNNPFSYQQYFPQQPAYNTQQTQSAFVPAEAPPPGWDGTTTWRPPASWTEPDLSDPRPWF